MSNSLAIEVQKLDKTYREGWLGRRSFQALKGVTFEVGRGEIFGLLGPNGAGKTTFIKILLGIIRKSGGSATMLGRPAGDRGGRRDVGYLPENLKIPRHHTALSALELYGRLSGMSYADIRGRQHTLLDSVGLADWARASVRKYSKGMLQRLGLAQSLLHDPQLLFLDEPTDGLDPVGRTHVRTVLHGLKAEGKTIFLNSHLLQEVELICDRVAILNHGELLGIGSVNQLAAKRHRQGIELECELAGTEASLRAAIGQREISSLVPLPGDRMELKIVVPDQAAVDQLIDALRHASISIVRVAPRRITLEDAFLDILGKKNS